MSVNYQQVYSKIREIRSQAQAHQETLRQRREEARRLLETFDQETDWLRERLEETLKVYPDLRCAIPLEHSLTARHPLPQTPPPEHTLLAADGSQIAPDRHAAVLFALINIGLIRLQPGSGQAPFIFTESQLLFDEELYEDGDLLSDGMLAMRRDLRERALLVEHAQKSPRPAIALTDGPLELWGLTEAESTDSYRRALEEYLRLLRSLRGENVIPAGYVDKPMANLVVRLLEIATLPTEKLKDAKSSYPLRGVTDRWLFGERGRPLLRAGERSAVFGLQSQSRQFYREEIALHFFYLNVGDDEHPWPVRVEIPAWVAEDPTLLNLLHAALVDQCRQMGTRPFPYLLHRAHEIALVSYEDKRQIENWLAIEQRSMGWETDEDSAKRVSKEGSYR
jgi:hypothetical protein